VLGDDRWIAIGAFTQEEWLALIRVLGHTEWGYDERFVTLDQRLENQDVLEALVAEATATRDGIELMAELRTVGVPAGICETTQDRLEWDPQLEHLRWTMEFAQSEVGRWPAKTPPTWFKMKRRPTREESPIGTHRTMARITITYTVKYWD
jgi:crotonobetainyl-CoA:carnitine CoA-transferase CaiB-like acyl-CoA transferase